MDIHVEKVIAPGLLRSFFLRTAQRRSSPTYDNSLGRLARKLHRPRPALTPTEFHSSV